MKHTIKIVILVLTTFTALQASAANDDHFGLGAKLLLGNWKGDNNGNTPSFDAKANQLALSFRYQHKQFYAGLSLQGSSYSFSDGAPERNYKNSYYSDSSVTIDRNETDLLAGYYFWPQVSFFADIKSVTNTWKDKNYSAKYTGLGLGIAGFIPLQNHWTFYASFGIVPLKITERGNTIGDGSGGSLELGGTYTVNAHNSLSVGIKSQSQHYDFDNGHKQTHHLGGLTLGYSYNF